MLKVYTAPIDYDGDKKKLDVTVKSGDETFAPTWRMVMKTKQGEMTWEEYREEYYEMMRESYRQNQKRWQELLSEEEIVLLCYCRSPEKCHRRLLAEMLAEAGADYEGDLKPEKDGGEEDETQ